MFENSRQWASAEGGWGSFFIVGTLTCILPNQLICWYPKDIYKPQILLKEETRSKYVIRLLILEKARARLFKCHIKCKLISIYQLHATPGIIR